VRELRAWNVSWNGSPDSPSVVGAISAIVRVIRAASGHGCMGPCFLQTAGQWFESAHRIPESPRSETYFLGAAVITDPQAVERVTRSTNAINATYHHLGSHSR
jgi:hypothetical protein